MQPRYGKGSLGEFNPTQTMENDLNGYLPVMMSYPNRRGWASHTETRRHPVIIDNSAPLREEAVIGGVMRKAQRLSDLLIQTHVLPKRAGSMLRQVSRRNAVGIVGALALVLASSGAARADTPEGNQNAMLGNIALAIAAYKASADQCYYDAKDGKILSDADAFFTRRLPDDWPRLRDSAPDNLPMLQNAARLMGAKSDCVALGNAVGMGLIAALYTGQLDGTVGAEMDRLLKGGGRGKSDPAPAGPLAPPQQTAAETVKAWREANPNAGMPAPPSASSIGAGYAKMDNLPPAPARPATVGPQIAAPIGGQRATPPVIRTQEAATGVVQEPALSDCLENVDLGYNKNEQFARCYSSALAHEDKRLNSEFATLKDRLYSPTSFQR